MLLLFVSFYRKFLLLDNLIVHGVPLLLKVLDWHVTVFQNLLIDSTYNRFNLLVSTLSDD